MDSTWWQFAVLAICLFLAGFASAAETALTSLGRLRIRHLADEGNRGAQQLQQMLSSPGDFLSTILVVNNVAVIVASTLTALLTVELWRDFHGAEAITTAALSIFILVFCEITPKTLAIRNAEAWALRLAGPVRATSWVLGWLVHVLAAIPPLLMRMVGAHPSPKSPLATEEEIRFLVTAAEEEGVIEQSEEQMIHSIFEFGETTAREIMVPRVDMKAVDVDTPMKDVIDLTLQVGHSRIPVYEENVDNIIGTVFDRDLFKYFREQEVDVPLREALRPAYFVPESKKVDELLRELQKNRVQMAIVVDEYGGTAGLVTIEDILEEIVGEIQDEFDAEEDPIQQVSENEAVFNALVHMDDVNEWLDMDLEVEDVDTLGGYVYSHLGKMPVSGDEFEVENVNFSVVSIVGRRIKKVRVVKQPPNSTGNGKSDTPAEQ